MQPEQIHLITGMKNGSTAITGKQYYIAEGVACGSNLCVALADASAVFLLGVLLNEPGANEAAAVAGPGSIVGVRTGAQVTAGQMLTADDNGAAIPAAPSAGANKAVLGVALTSAASGAIAQVYVHPYVMQGA